MADRVTQALDELGKSGGTDRVHSVLDELFGPKKTPAPAPEPVQSGPFALRHQTEAQPLDAAFGMQPAPSETVNRVEELFKEPAPSEGQLAVQAAREKAAPKQSTPGYLAHGLESGLYAVGGMAGDIAQAYNPITAAKEMWLRTKYAATHLIGNADTAGSDYLKTEGAIDAAGNTPLTRFAESMQRESEALANSPDGQKYNQLTYATTDPSKSALLSPVRILHDALQSLPSTGAMAATIYLTRGAAIKGYSEAIAAGFSEAEANAIAVQAAGKVATVAGALGEGTVGGVQQSTQTRVQVLDGEDPTKSTVYQAMIKAGVGKEDAKHYVATQAGDIAGIAGGVVDAATNMAEGPILGRIISEGGPLVTRVGKGILAEGIQEGVQGAGEQVGQNAATKLYVDPQQKLSDGIAENVLQSFVVGGVTGGAFAGVGGVPEHAADTVEPASPPQHVPLAPPEPVNVPLTEADHASPIPDTIIQQGKNLAADALAKMPGIAPTVSPQDERAAFQAHVRGAESGGRDTATNPNSTATGRYQFTKGTWERLGGDWNNRFDAGEQERLMQKLTDQNEAGLVKGGVPLTRGNYYLAHFAGVGGAVALNRNPDATAEQVLGENVIKANPFLAGMKARDVVAWASKRMGGPTTDLASNPLGGVGGIVASEEANPAGDTESTIDTVNRVLGEDITAFQPGQKVAITQNGQTVHGTVAETYGTGIDHGARIPLENGTTFDETLARAKEYGAQITAPIDPNEAPSVAVPDVATPTTVAAPANPALDAVSKGNANQLDQATQDGLVRDGLAQWQGGNLTLTDQGQAGLDAQPVAPDLGPDATAATKSDNQPDLTTALSDIGRPFNPVEHIPALKEVISKSNVSLSDIKTIAAKLGVKPNQARAVMGALASQPKSGFTISKKGNFRRVPRRTAPMTAMEFVRSIGGVQPGSHDLRNVGALARHPGVINKNGKPLDEVGRALHEAGYFVGLDPTNPDKRPTEAETIDFLEHASGKRSYANGEQPAEQVDHGQNEHEMRSAIENEIADTGIKFNDDEIADAVRYMHSGYSPHEAVEEARNDAAARSLEHLSELSGDDFYDSIKDSIYEGEHPQQRDSGAQEGVTGSPSDQGSQGGSSPADAQPNEGAAPEQVTPPSKMDELNARRVAKSESAAPEHVAVGVDDRELDQIVSEFGKAADVAGYGEDQVHHLFDAPAKGEIVRLKDRSAAYVKQHGWMTPEEAQTQVRAWEDHAVKQGQDPAIRSANGQKVVLSLFDLSGEMALPWQQAGYEVYTFDIQKDAELGDINNFSIDYFSDIYGQFEGKEIHAILAGCPCTDFASSGARHFAAKDKDGRTVASVALVHQTLATIEYFKPAVWQIENPVGRIEKLTGLPPWRLSLDPNDVGEPYTKKTLFWGRFNANLPVAPVEPTEGSKMWSQYGGKSLATKNARSATPEGLSYAFFMANNAHDHPAMTIANTFDRLDRGLIERAVKAGVTEEQIAAAVEDHYYQDLDDEAANAAIQDLIDKASPADVLAERPGDQRTALERQGEGRLKATKEQKAPGSDGGLFDNTGARQADIFDKPAAPAARDTASPIGTNARGQSIYEDANGVRSIIDQGVRLTEPVELIPQRQGGYAPGVNTSRREARFQTAAERPAPTEHPGLVVKSLETGKETTIQPPGTVAPADYPAWFKALPAGQGPHVAAGRADFLAGKPRVLPSYFTGPSANSRAWYRGWDEANLAAPVPDSTGTEPATTRSASYGSANKLVTQARAEELRAKLRDKFKNQLNAGIDPEMLAAGTELAVFHIEAGVRKFADFATTMATDLQTTVAKLKPFLRAWYLGAQMMIEDGGGEIDGMDGPGAVRAAVSMIPDEAGVSTPVNGIVDNGGQNGATPNPDGSAAGQRPQGVQPSQPVEPTGAVDSGQGQGGEGALRPTDQTRGAPTERGGEGPASSTDSRGNGDRADGRRNNERRAEASGAGNFIIRPGALDEKRGPMAKARDNLAAIEIVRTLEREERGATPAEQEALAKYVGWGGLKNAFPDGTGAFGKGFEDIGPRLRELLTPEQWDTARRSIQYAHYTAERVVRQMWAAAERFGFKGGGVFEPGMGTGNFIGMVPDAIRGSTSYSGIEMDGITAAIAKALYPESGVREADYTEFNPGKNAFPLVIGNPPFSDTVIKSDPEYRNLGFVLHDYFFAKSLDAVQPGGALLFVTSAGTMNKIDSSAREWLAERAWLAGAIRLPGDAFAENAGTSVTTDIVMLRKKVEGETRPEWAAPDNWTGTVGRNLPNNDGERDVVQVSNYFASNPDMVLGEEGRFDKLYLNRYGVRGTGDLTPKLAAAVERLPSNIIATHEGPALTVRDFESTEHKNGSFYVKDGKLLQHGPGGGVEYAPKSARDSEVIRALLPLRDTLREVYAHDLAERTGAAAEARARLNKAYDAFLAKHGPINKGVFLRRRPNRVQLESARRRAREEARAQGHEWDDGSFDPSALYDSGATVAEVARARDEARAAAGKSFDEGSFDPETVSDTVTEKRPNLNPFLDDPESYRLAAIEHYDDITGTSEKGPVFFGSVVRKQPEPQINGPEDALRYVMNARGRVDLEEIAALAGVSPDEAATALTNQIYRDPESGDWQSAAKYLSGNVRTKLAAAEKAAADDPALRPNVDALRQVIPPDRGPSEVRATLGMTWIDPTDIEDFAVNHLGLANATVKYRPKLAEWSAHGDTYSAASTSTWGTGRRSAMELLNDALNQATVKITDPIDGDSSKRVLNERETQAANDKLTAIREEFSKWIWADEARTNRLLRVYNDLFNSHVAPSYDGSHMTTPGVSAHWKWCPHQLRGIARIVEDGNAYLAHAVGAGKTSTAIASIMEMKRLGLVNKPMIVVPNHMLVQFTKEFYELYPLANIMVADEDRSFVTHRRKQFVADMASNDIDAVIIKHSAFGLVPLSETFQRRLLQDHLAELRSMLAEMKASGDDRITRSKVENLIQKAEERMRAVTTRRTDKTFTFEETGVDHITVDEAHMFRKLDYASRRSNIKGIDPGGSQRAMDLYMKAQYLEGRRPGRNLTLMSGTPITNTMAELYSIQRFLQPAELRARGVAHFDAWANSFGDVVTDLEPTAGGQYKSQTRFARFVNVPELSVMVRQVMDVVTSEQLGQYVVRPKVTRELVNVPVTDSQSNYVDKLAAREKAIANRGGRPEKGDDILLTVIGDGRKSAIDMRLIDPSHPAEDNKLERLIDNAHRVWKETKNQPFHDITPDGYSAKPTVHGPAAQMIFSSLGVGANSPFNVHRHIADSLVKRGVPKDQIVLFNYVKNDVAKQKVFNDTNAGKVRFLIGSVEKMGTGVNAQRRLVANHNLDPEWLPSSDEQRNGRINRQGNMNPEVRIFDYATKGTYDSQMWGMMGRKAKFIEGFFRGDPTMRDMEDLGEASTYEQIKALTTKDPRILHLTEYRQELDKELRRRDAHESARYTNARRAQAARAWVETLTGTLAVEQKDAAQVESIKGDDFKATIGNETFTERAKFQEALNAATEAATREGTTHIGSIGGFPLALHVDSRQTLVGHKIENKLDHRVLLMLNRKPGEVDTRYSKLARGDTAASAAATLARIQAQPAETQSQIDRYQKEAEQFAALAANVEPYAGEAKIAELQGQVKAIQDQLAAEEKAAAAANGPKASVADETPAAQPSDNPITGRNEAEFRAELEAQMKVLLPNDNIALRVARGMTIDGLKVGGQYWNRIITMGIDTAHNPTWVLAHETVHAMKAMGLFTPSEWSALVNAAWTKNAKAELDVRRRWGPLNLTETELQEEAVAEHFGQNWDNHTYLGSSLARRALRRMVGFIHGVARAVHKFVIKGEAPPTAGEVMAKMRTGEVGSREVGFGEPARDKPERPLTVRFGNKPSASVVGDMTPAGPEFEGNSEERWQEAKKGVGGGPGMAENAKAWWQDLTAGFTRHWRALPNEPRFADVQQQLRKLEAAPDAAMAESIRYLKSLVGGMSAKEYDLFARKVVLDDLSWDAGEGRELPFGFNPSSLVEARARVDQQINLDPKMVAAVRSRKDHNAKIADQMVSSGVLTREQIKNPAYFRHMVLDYARHEAALARSPTKIKSPYWAKRMGSTLDINANLLEAELDWLQKAQIDVATAGTIDWIKNSNHNIREELRTQARDSNRQLLDEAISRDSGIAKEDKWFRGNIGHGLSIVRKEIEAGNLGIIPDHLQEAAASLVAGDRKGDPPFALFAWILDNNKPGAMGAGMALKYIGLRKQWARKLLGDRYIEPEDIKGLVRHYKPEGMVAWQPREGQHLFTAKTISEHALDMFVSKLADTASPGLDRAELASALGSVRDQLVVGGDRYTMVIPEELAATLDEFGDRRGAGMVAHVFSGIQSAWKRWVLINFRRYFKYNINNMTGDLDAIIAGNPGTLRHVGRAWTILRDASKGNVDPRYTEALERGVFTSGLSAQEIPDINKFSEFRHLTEHSTRPDKLVVAGIAKVWRVLQDTTNFREALFRMAAYLDYSQKIDSGMPQSKIGYGASVPNMVDAVSDPKDKAALLARDLVGDYGSISTAGGWLRKYLVPFWSWTEINTRRYWRLTSNAFGQSYAKGVATGGLLGAGVAVRTATSLFIRMGMVYGLLYLWNNYRYPDEEKKLGEAQRAQLHLILGKDSDGNIITLRTQGALSDVLSEFGFQDAMLAFNHWRDGQGSPGKIATALAKGPVNRVATSTTPLLSIPIEEALGKKLWPDLFDPQIIHDKWRHLFQAVSMENEYDLAAGKPSRGYGRSWTESLVYRRDPDEMSYDQAKSYAYDWLERVKGQEGGGFSSPRSEALRDYRMAVRYGDTKAANKALDTYVSLGGTDRGFASSIARQHPLGPIPKKDRAEFLASLTPDQLQVEADAEDYWKRAYKGGS